MTEAEFEALLSKLEAGSLSEGQVAASRMHFVHGINDLDLCARTGGVPTDDVVVALRSIHRAVNGKNPDSDGLPEWVYRAMIPPLKFLIRILDLLLWINWPAVGTGIQVLLISVQVVVALWLVISMTLDAGIIGFFLALFCLWLIRELARSWFR